MSKPIGICRIVKVLEQKWSKFDKRTNHVDDVISDISCIADGGVTSIFLKDREIREIKDQIDTSFM